MAIIATSGKRTVFDLKTYAVLGKVKAAEDADGVIYDPGSGKVLVVCGDAGVLIPVSPDLDVGTGKADAAVELGGKAPEPSLFEHECERDSITADQRVGLRVSVRPSPSTGNLLPLFHTSALTKPLSNYSTNYSSYPEPCKSNKQPA
jgi:hypothetical protein